MAWGMCSGLAACLERMILPIEGHETPESVPGLGIGLVGVTGFGAFAASFFFLGFLGVFIEDWRWVEGMAVSLLGLDKLAAEAWVCLGMGLEGGGQITVGSPSPFTVAQPGGISGSFDCEQLAKLQPRIVPLSRENSDIQEHAFRALYKDSISPDPRFYRSRAKITVCEVLGSKCVSKESNESQR